MTQHALYIADVYVLPEQQRREGVSKHMRRYIPPNFSLGAKSFYQEADGLFGKTRR